MMQLVFPDTPAHELALEPDATVKSLRPKVIKSRVVLAEPAAVPIRESTLGDDVDLKRFFAAQESQWSFHAVELRCTFAAGEGESFERALVTVQLSAPGDSAAQGPTAWSMSPLKLSQKKEVKESASVGSDLKFIKVEIGDEIKYTENELYLVAYNEQRADPYWRLKPVRGVTIEGIERLSMIVRVPKTAHAVGKLNVQADIRAKLFGGLISCTAAVPNIPQLSFSL